MAISAIDQGKLASVTTGRAVQSGFTKAGKKIPYSGAFGVELACDSKEHILLTADFDVSPAKDDVHVEFCRSKIRANESCR